VAASRGRVVEVATHELGTPVQVVWLSLSLGLRYAGLVQKAAREGSVPQTESVDELVGSLQRALEAVQGVRARFIDPLRAYYDLEMLIDRLRPSLVQPRDLDMMLARWRGLAAWRRLQAFSRLPVGLRVDVALFDRALTNLVTNAVKYSKPGSLIVLEANRVEDELVISVQDEGVGIPERDVPYIGAWLYRGENVANVASFPPGLGMGVYAARRIAEAHGGRLEIESELGKGTRATLILPAFVESP
jgi:signal transduction histidine kinase